MAKFYTVLLLLLGYFTTGAQNIKETSYTQLKDALYQFSASDPRFETALHRYHHKALQEHNLKELFKVYTLYLPQQHPGTAMHHYADSLLLLAKQLPVAYQIEALQAKALCYYTEKDYRNSLAYEMQALELADPKKDAYAYYTGMYNIGQVYFYIQDYDKAYQYYRQAREYFESVADYKHLQGYLAALYREAFVLYYLKDYAQSTALLERGQQKMHALDSDDFKMNESYYEYVMGLNHFRNGQYAQSIALLEKALPAIAANDDFANAAVVYYHLGQNYLKQQDTENALAYFMKVDDIFEHHGYSHPEVKDAYNRIASYYHAQDNPKMELLYTNKLLNVTRYLQKEYSFLTEVLHTDIDLKRLEAEKMRLEQILSKKSAAIYFLVAAALLVLLGFVWTLLAKIRKKKEYEKNYQQLMKQREQMMPVPVYARAAAVNGIAVVPTGNWQEYTLPITPDKPTTAALNDDTQNNLMARLELFEQEKGYLNKELQLDDLATWCQTNRTYLSKFLNSHKGIAYHDYINGLRIAYCLEMLDSDSKWLHYKMKVIAELSGFKSSRSFANAFLKSVKIAPTFYIEKQKNSTKPVKKVLTTAVPVLEECPEI